MTDKSKKADKPFTLRYIFSLANGVDKEFTIRLDSKSLGAIAAKKNPIPSGRN